MEVVKHASSLSFHESFFRLTFLRSSIYNLYVKPWRKAFKTESAASYRLKDILFCFWAYQIFFRSHGVLVKNYQSTGKSSVTNLLKFHSLSLSVLSKMEFWFLFCSYAISELTCKYHKSFRKYNIQFYEAVLKLLSRDENSLTENGSVMEILFSHDDYTILKNSCTVNFLDELTWHSGMKKKKKLLIIRIRYR